MIKIAIIEDEEHYQTAIKTVIEKIVINIDTRTSCFNNARDFFNTKEDYDIILLDIDLPDMNGIEVAKALMDESIIIIYITNHKHFSESAYGINVYKYILKSKLEEQFPKSFNEVINIIENRKNIKLNTEEGLVKFKGCEIYCILFENKKIILSTRYKKHILKYRTLKNVFGQLPSCFIRINKDIIINSNYIKSIKNDYVIIEFLDIELSYSRRNKGLITNVFNNQVDKL